MTKNSKSIVSIFIGGTYEVRAERLLAERIINRYFKRIHKNDFIINAFTYDGADGRAAVVSEIAQDGIEKCADPASCDIAMFVFRWKLGTPQSFDGKSYPSMSARELERALEAVPRPSIAVFRHGKAPDPIIVDEDLPEYQKAELRRLKIERPAQYAILGDYLERLGREYAEPNFNINYFDDIDDLERQLIDVLDRELKAVLARIRLGAGPGPDPSHRPRRPDGWPFRGLDELQLDDQEIFFGREVETRELLRRFSADRDLRFLCIYGASGTGKSSLMRAGLLPRLRATLDQPSSSACEERIIVLLKPSELVGNPFLSIAEQVRDQPGTPITKSELLANDLRNACTAGTAQAKEALDRLVVRTLIGPANAGREIVLAVDQLEELWTTVSESVRTSFLNLLAAAAEHQSVRVVVTIRNDLYHEFTDVDVLREQFKKPNTGFLLLPPLGDQIGRMIREPLKVAGIESEDLEGLVHRILRDSDDLGSGALPLIAHTLREMRLGANPNRFTLVDYESVGGVRQAIKYSVDQALEVVRGRASVLDILFDRLVSFKSGRPERSRVAMSELVAAGIDRVNVIEKLIACRVLLISQEDRVELAHQALFTAWPELQLWIEDTKADRAALSVIERDAQIWHENGRQHRDIRLSRVAIDWIEPYVDERSSLFPESSLVEQYIKAALVEQKREQLIYSVKGGHVTSALEAVRGGARLRPEDCGQPQAEWYQLWPAFYAAVTGDDGVGGQISLDGEPGRSVFDDPDELMRVTSRNMTPLDWAAVFGHLDLVKKFVAKGVDPKHLDAGGASSVSSAAYSGHLDIVRYLVEECGVDPCIEDSGGNSAISWAFQQRHDAVVSYLESKGVPLELNAKHGWNLLTEAVRRGTLDTVKALIESKRYEVDCRTADGQTPVFVACLKGKSEHIEIIRYLVSCGASLEARSASGITALHVAAQVESIPLIEYIVDAGLSVDVVSDGGETPLHWAAFAGKAKSIKCLAARGADPNMMSKAGGTPLMAAVVARQNRAVAALLRSGADPNVFGDGQWSPLHYIADDGDLSLLDILLSHARGLDINLLVPPGWTPIMVAASKGHLGIIERLLNHRDEKQGCLADIGIVDEQGLDAMAIAFMAGNQDVVRYIKQWIRANERWANDEQRVAAQDALRRQESVERSVERAYVSGFGTRQLIDADDLGSKFVREPDLIRAAEAGDLQRLESLLQAGADLAATGENGRTALHAAVRVGSIEAINALSRAGADVNQRDHSGLMPVELADRLGQLDAAQRLVAAGASEPAAWGKPRVSDVASFLTFEDVPASELPAVRRSLELLSRLHVPAEFRRYRQAQLSWYDGTRLLAIEDVRRKGLREQFVLDPQGAAPVLLDWTNEPIYDFNNTGRIRLGEAEVLAYTRFFFHFVRGQLGRFIIVDREKMIPWSSEATPELKQETAKKLRPLCITEKIAMGQVLMRATVVFKNALFYTDIRLATETTLVAPEKDENEDDVAADEPLELQQWSPGQVRLENEVLVAEDLPVEVDGPPGLFG